MLEKIRIFFQFGKANSIDYKTIEYFEAKMGLKNKNIEERANHLPSIELLTTCQRNKKNNTIFQYS